MTLPNTPIDLAPGQVHRVRLKAGELLLVREGRVWLTREGDPVDHVLVPGRGHVAPLAEEVVIESCAPTGSRYERHTLHLMRHLSTTWPTWLRSEKFDAGR